MAKRASKIDNHAEFYFNINSLYTKTPKMQMSSPIVYIKRTVTQWVIRTPPRIFVSLPPNLAICSRLVWMPQLRFALFLIFFFTEIFHFLSGNFFGFVYRLLFFIVFVHNHNLRSLQSEIALVEDVVGIRGKFRSLCGS